jgi:hypothetical protein
LAILLLSVLCASIWIGRKGERDFGQTISRIDKLLEKEYSEIKSNNNKLLRLRKELLDKAITRCLSLKDKLNSSGCDAGSEIYEAIEAAVESLLTNEIEDGIPRLVLCLFLPDSNFIRIVWVESDFNTLAVNFANDDQSIAVEERVFRNHNLEKRYFFDYYRVFDARTQSINDPARLTKGGIKVIIEYDERGVPFFGPAFFLPGQEDIACVRIPKDSFAVWLRDKAGNESNRLPIVRTTAEILSKLPPLRIGDVKID